MVKRNFLVGENMDVQQQNNLEKNGQIRDIKKCPRCRSVYLTDKECEACGFQLNFGFIGEPFGHLSFFHARDNFYSMGTLRKIAYFVLGKKYSRYIKYELVLKRRLNNLLEYFFDHIDHVDKRRKFFFLEMTQLADEFKVIERGLYLSERIKDKVMTSEVEKIGYNSIYISQITSWINHTVQSKRSPKDYLSIKLFGAITVGNIMLIFFIQLVFVMVLIKMFPYFLKH